MNPYTKESNKINPYTKEGEGTSVGAGSPWPVSQPSSPGRAQNLFLTLCVKKDSAFHFKRKVCCGR